MNFYFKKSLAIPLFILKYNSVRLYGVFTDDQKIVGRTQVRGGKLVVYVFDPYERNTRRAATGLSPKNRYITLVLMHHTLLVYIIYMGPLFSFR